MFLSCNYQPTVFPFLALCSLFFIIMLYVSGTETSCIVLLFVVIVESFFDSIDDNDSSLLERKFTISGIVFDFFFKLGYILSTVEIMCTE